MKLLAKIAFGVLLAAVLGAAGVGVNRLLMSLRRAPGEIPAVKVLRGPVEVRVYTVGELRPTRNAMMVAPSVGGVLQIVRLVKTGVYVNEGDIVAEFDPAEQEYNLEQNRSQLEEAEQEIRKMKADAAVRAAQDKVSLLRAQFDVRRAELTVRGNELLSAIEARKNEINLEEARRRLEQMERDVESRASSDQADLAVLMNKRSRAMLTMNLAQQNIDNMTLRAPISGIVSLSQNQDATGGLFISGMELPEFREGDQTYPGRMIAQILDVGQMEILSKVTESDRGSLDKGQAIEVHVDALPVRSFSGEVKSLAGMAAAQFLDFSSSRTFDAAFTMDAEDAKLGPGISAQVMIRAGNLSDALSVPRQALFMKEGKPVVYVKRGDGWEASPIQIKHLTESRAIIEGVVEGTEVALVAPDQKKESVPAKAGTLAPVSGNGSR